MRNTSANRQTGGANTQYIFGGSIWLWMRL